MENVYTCIKLFFIFWVSLYSFAQGHDTNQPVLAIIGGGPAGLTAAIYGARAHIKTVVIVGDAPGGLLLGAGMVENMPGIAPQPGYQIMETMLQQAASFGVELWYSSKVTSIEQDTNTKCFVIHTESDVEPMVRDLVAHAVIIASGSTPKRLGVVGEDTYWGAGVTACAVCDCMRVRDAGAIVVGGGDSAIEHVLHLQHYAHTITLVVRGGSLRASAHMQEKLKVLKQVTVLYNTVVECIEGDGQEMTHAVLKSSKTGALQTVQAKGLFLAIGHVPNTTFCPPRVERLSDGTILLPTRSQQTTCPGIFAAGDVADNTYRQACIAAGSGAQAAIEAIAYIRR